MLFWTPAVDSHPCPWPCILSGIPPAKVPSSISVLFALERLDGGLAQEGACYRRIKPSEDEKLDKAEVFLEQLCTRLHTLVIISPGLAFGFLDCWCSGRADMSNLTCLVLQGGRIPWRSLHKRSGLCCLSGMPQVSQSILFIIAIINP